MTLPALGGVRPVVLWTDALWYLLLVLAAAAALLGRRREPSRRAWGRVFRKPAAVSAAVILATFATIALLDSLHFQTVSAGRGGARRDSAVHSVLDVLCAPLIRHEERTYSAPFALHALEPVSVPQGHGEVARVFPRLRWAGRGLRGARATDLVRRALRGGLEGASFWLLVVTVWMALRRNRKTLGRPALVFWITLAAVLVLIGVVGQWATAYHVLGTDQVGTDVLFKSLKSIRTGVIIGTVSTGVMLPFALALGLTAGYFGGLADDLIQYLYTTLNSVPGVLLIAASVLSLDLFLGKQGGQYASALQRADLHLLFLCLILGMTGWTSLCRLLRAETLKLRELEYVQCARLLGERAPRVLIQHILPNVLHIVIITLALDFSGLVLAEAVLTYLGVGVGPGLYSWGNTINAARLELAREPVVWWDLASALGFMSLLVLAANVFADAVREAFDPRHEESDGD